MKRILATLALLVGFIATSEAQLPKVMLKDINGKTVNTAQLADGKSPIIVSFFATWCKPCLRELAAIAEVYDEWQDETGVRLVAVSIDEGANSLKVKPLVRSKGWSYEVLLDVNSDLKRAMDVSVVPSLFILDPSGKIVYRHTGYTDGSEMKLIDELRKIRRK